MAGKRVITVTAPEGGLAGALRAIPSKSQAHRALICAALSGKPSRVVCADPSDDILATAACLRALGAGVAYGAGVFEVTPIPRVSGHDAQRQPPLDLYCGESGTTLRLLLPIVAALGRSARFHRAGRLAQRPLSPLYEELAAHGCRLGPPSAEPLTLSGRLEPGRFHLNGGVSSQFISGLLFALPLLAGPSELCLTGALQSRPYVDMTLSALRGSGVEVMSGDAAFSCAGPQAYRVPDEVVVEGDWSNAAFWLCAGALSARSVTVTGLDPASRQGDRGVIDILRRFGARVEVAQDQVRVRGGRALLRGIEIDARDIPDLAPVLAVVGAAASGQTTITGAGRLRLKESDRLAATCDVLGRLGARIQVTDDGLEMCGAQQLVAATVDAWGDHRIAMTAAIASLLCADPVTITGADAVNKSYPRFFEDFEALGGQARADSFARVDKQSRCARPAKQGAGRKGISL